MTRYTAGIFVLVLIPQLRTKVENPKTIEIIVGKLFHPSFSFTLYGLFGFEFVNGNFSALIAREAGKEKRGRVCFCFYCLLTDYPEQNFYANERLGCQIESGLAGRSCDGVDANGKAMDFRCNNKNA